MALGKNLKKQQLIPNAEKGSSDPGGDQKGGKAKPPKKEKASRKPGSGNSAGKQEKTKALSKKASDKLPQEKEIIKTENDRPGTKYISAAEYQQREKRKAKFDQELKALKDKKIHLIVFRLGAEEYAVEISKTREVVVTPPISRAPHTPTYIRGVANIRGSVVMAVDLAQKFRLHHAEMDDERVPGYTMVLNHNRYKVGILIDEVPITLVVSGSSISSSKGILTEESIHETYIKGVVKEKDRMIFFVDVDELLEADKVHVLPEATE